MDPSNIHLHPQAEHSHILPVTIPMEDIVPQVEEVVPLYIDFGSDFLGGSHVTEGHTDPPQGLKAYRRDQGMLADGA